MQCRWTDGRKTWEFAASSDEKFRDAALDALISARQESARRVHDGGSHRPYHEYPQLRLDLYHGRQWYIATAVPAMRLWEDLPPWIQGHPYRPEEWLAAVRRLQSWLQELDGFASAVGDVLRRPSEWGK